MIREKIERLKERGENVNNAFYILHFSLLGKLLLLINEKYRM